jgi:hypothetical protein
MHDIEDGMQPDAYALTGMNIRGAVESDAPGWHFGEVLLCLHALYRSVLRNQSACGRSSGRRTPKPQMRRSSSFAPMRIGLDAADRDHEVVESGIVICQIKAELIQLLDHCTQIRC